MTRPSPLPIQAADLRGLLRLGVDATLGITSVVEAMHHTIASRLGVMPAANDGRTNGLTGLVYRSVRGVARAAGQGVEASLTAWEGWRPSAQSTSAEREAVLAALNGVFGDHLADTLNPLAIRMTLRQGGQPLDLDLGQLGAQLPQASGRVLVLVHGLCMNDLQWARQGTDHGQALAAALGMTPVYLHYNSGRHVSQNGRDFAALLERLLQAWPRPLDELAIVGHSMGGLVTRSACHQALQAGLAWPQRLRHLVFLGTPHHGAPLERGGRLVDQLFGISPYAQPFARLSRARSAGITDLRYGNLQDADWQGRNRHDQQHDDRQPTPLPPQVAACVVAATLAEAAPGARARRRDQVVGDGLVPLASALGEHADPALALDIPPQRRLVLAGANHWDLLSRAEVGDQLQRWLA